MPEKLDLLIIRIKQLLTIKEDNKAHSGVEAMNNLGIIENGAVGIKDGKIVAVGTTTELLEKYQSEIGRIGKVLDAKDKIVMPGFVDAHTHPVFYGTREKEFEMRLQGKSYQKIAASGGGIRSSVRMTRRASKEQLTEEALKHLNRMLKYGTTTIEAKSGYGLSLESEIKQLEVIKELKDKHPIEMVATFLGAHEVPDEYRDNRNEYIRILKEEMLPQIAEKNLAELCDIFCEDGVFTIDESRDILTSAKKYGFKLKLHADELEVSFGGAELAAELGAISADHLGAISDNGIQLLKEKNVIPVLLPGTIFSLGLKNYAPARKMIDEGLAVALATDCNPGSCMTESIPIIITLSCVMMRMTVAEAITAATINSAYAINRGEKIGSIEIGKQADLILLDIPSYHYLPYHFGVNNIHTVIKRGKIVSE